MPNRTAQSHVKAYTAIHNRLVQAGLWPQFHISDNECSQLLRTHLQQQNVQVQTTPARLH